MTELLFITPDVQWRHSVTGWNHCRVSAPLGRRDGVWDALTSKSDFSSLCSLYCIYPDVTVMQLSHYRLYDYSKDCVWMTESQQNPPFPPFFNININTDCSHPGTRCSLVSGCLCMSQTNKHKMVSQGELQSSPPTWEHGSRQFSLNCNDFHPRMFLTDLLAKSAKCANLN